MMGDATVLPLSASTFSKMLEHTCQKNGDYILYNNISTTYYRVSFIYLFGPPSFFFFSGFGLYPFFFLKKMPISFISQSQIPSLSMQD